MQRSKLMEQTKPLSAKIETNSVHLSKQYEWLLEIGNSKKEWSNVLCFTIETSVWEQFE